MRPRPRPRLERRNAQRYDHDLYEAGPSIQSPSIDFLTQSLEVLPSYANRTSFRIRGASDGEIDVICRSLGLSGPEDFAIPAAAWEARRSRSASDRLAPSRLLNLRYDGEAVDGDVNGVRGPLPTPQPLDTPEVRADVEAGDGVVDKVGSGDGVRVEERSRDGDGRVMSNGDDAPSTMMEVERTIKDWLRGRELGRGSFGTVYEAVNHDGFFFAVKEVSLLDQGSNAQQCIQQLEQEIALLSHFEHENIVKYLGTEKGEAKLFIFLELVTQGSLASLYQKYQLRDSQVSSYTRQILHGLKYLHDKNVVHRDIKCANILVAASGAVKLADFGLAKEMSKLNALKSCKGSVYWMAPEVVMPRRPYGSAADIWSLGCTVLEMLTQRLPYPDLDWTQAMFKIGRGQNPEIPESLSSDAHNFISQCLRVDPDDRPDAGKLLDHPFVRRQYSNGAALGSDGSSHGRRIRAT